MKSILLLLVLGLASYANAQGAEFVVDNILSPLVENVGSNLQTFLFENLGTLANQVGSTLGGWFSGLFGKRGVFDLIQAIKSFIQKYETDLKKIAKDFIDAVRAQLILMNPLILDKPIPMESKFNSLLSDASQQIQSVSHNLINELFTIFQNVFGQHFEIIKETFLHSSTIVSNFSQQLVSVLNSFGQNIIENQS